MAVIELSGREALRRLKENEAARWSSGWGNEALPGTAWQRLRDEFFSPRIAPAFAIERSDSIFAIGSCFAREVESRLATLGFDVTSRSPVFERFGKPQGDAWPFGFANKYNPHAILNELRWALDPDQAFPLDAIVQIAPDEWHDPHVHPIFGRVPLEAAVEQHATLTRLVAQLPTCRVVVVTLGLIETWFDTALGLYTNATPWLVQHVQDRFRFHVLSYTEVMDALRGIHEVLTRFADPRVHILVTVSLVPLDATFTGSDVVLANTHSKSLLRAAAAEWANDFDNVHYFPSYEIVMNSDRSQTWYVDGRHVRVEAVLDLFSQAYVAEPPGSRRGCELADTRPPRL